MSCCVNNHTDDYIKIIVQNPITYTFCLFPFVFLSLHWFPLVSMTFLSISHFPFQFPPPHARAQTTERWRGLAPPDRLFPFLLLSASLLLQLRQPHTSQDGLARHLLWPVTPCTILVPCVAFLMCWLFSDAHPVCTLFHFFGSVPLFASLYWSFGFDVVLGDGTSWYQLLLLSLICFAPLPCIVVQFVLGFFAIQ
jgi:hypothetical protein